MLSGGSPNRFLLEISPRNHVDNGCTSSPHPHAVATTNPRGFIWASLPSRSVRAHVPPRSAMAIPVHRSGCTDYQPDCIDDIWFGPVRRRPSVVCHPCAFRGHGDTGCVVGFRRMGFARSPGNIGRHRRCRLGAGGALTGREYFVEK